MPTYEFKCACGLVFERRLQMSGPEYKHKCPRCGENAPKKLSPTTCTYSFRTDGTVNPQCTGLSGVDADYDRVIGEDADQKWKIQEERDRVKREIARKNGVKKEDLAVSEDGYRVMDKEEKRVIRNLRGFNNLAISSLNRKDGEDILDHIGVRRIKK